MAFVKATERRVHYDRTSEWGIVLKSAHEGECYYMFRASRPRIFRFAVYVPNGQAIALIDR